MFDLFRSREKLVRYMLGGLLVIVAASMITYLIPSYGLTNGDSGDPILAEVGNDKITTQEMQTTIENLVRGGKITAENAEASVPQFVDEMIQQRALLYQFSGMGMTVTDDEVLVGLMSLYPQYFENGKLKSKDEFEQYLATQNVSMADTIEAVRRQLMLRKIENAVINGVVVSPQEVDEALKQKHEKAKIEYVAFPAAKFMDQVKAPTPDDLRKTYEAHRDLYKLPEKRSFQVLVVDQQKLEQGMTISDAEVRGAYTASMDNYRTPERVKVRHILLMTQGKSDAEKKAILAKAQDLLKQVRGGADFAELAKKNSEDPGSAQNGGDLGFIVRGQTVPEFEKFVFSAQPKQISDIITTQYGYHIIQALEKEPARVKPYDEVKASLSDQLKKLAVNDKMQTLADQARAALEKSPGSAADIAKQLNLDFVNVDQSSPNDAIPTLGVSPEIDGALSVMQPKEISQPMVLPSNRLAIVELISRSPEKPAELADVRAQVESVYRTEQAQKLAETAANDAAAKIKAGEDMDKIAKSFKLDLAKPVEFTASDSVEGLGPAASVADAFTKPVGTVVGPLPVQGRNVIYKITGQQVPDLKEFAGERDAVTAQLKQTKARSQFDLFVDSVMTTLRSDKKIKIHEDSLKRLVAAYHQAR